MDYNKETKYRYSILIDSLGNNCKIVDQALRGLSASLTGKNSKVLSLVVSTEELSDKNKLEKGTNILSEFEQIRGFELKHFFRMNEQLKESIINDKDMQLNPRDSLLLENSIVLHFQKEEENIFLVIDINGAVCLFKKEEKING